MSEQKAVRDEARRRSLQDYKQDYELRNSRERVSGYVDGFGAGFAAASQEWVPIRSEADLPKRPGIYYVTLYDGTVGTSAFYVGGFDKSVIAWMPLPAPYVEEPGEVEGTNEKR